MANGFPMIWNLQALRGIAALLVVAHHMRDIAVPAGLGSFGIVVGAAGVDIFFVLSGVVIGLALCAPNQRPGAFARRRALRIVPLYWAATLVIAGLAALGLAPLGHRPGTLGWGEILKSLAFVPYLREPDLPLPVLGVGWTLNFEAFFYLLATVSLLLPPALRLRGLMLVLVSLVVLGLALPTGGLLMTFYTSPLLLEFAAGLGLAGWWLGKDRSAADLVSGLGLAGVGLALLVWQASWPGFAMLNPWRALVFGLPAVLIVAASLMFERTGLCLVRGPWQSLGVASFALYLSHPLALQAVSKLAAAMGLGPWATLALALGGVLGLAALTFALIERPLLVWLHRAGQTAPQGRDPPPGSPAVRSAQSQTRAQALPRW